MSEWREQIARRFVPGVAKITAVSDPDGLMRDPGVFQAIELRGFAILQFEESVSFRYDYESRFRSKWDAGAESEMIVVFKPAEYEFDTLPADILDRAHRVSLTLKEIFPKLSFAVVSQLESVYYDELYRAQQAYASSPHDETQTLGFVLRHVFQTEPAVIKSVPDLLKMLCERHHRKLSFPDILDEHLIATLRRHPDFQSWPLEQIIPQAAAFWEFLNERWPIYVSQSARSATEAKENAPSLKYPGLELLPFGHEAVRVHINNLFEEGVLRLTQWDWSQAIEPTWMRVGLLGNEIESTELRFEELGKNLMRDCPDRNTMPQSWLTFAYRYGQLRILWTQISPAKRTHFQKQLPELLGYVNQQFQAWLTSNYGGIFNYPASTPLMVHHIPGFISHRLTNRHCPRAAFILVDGLAIDQWLILRNALRDQGLNAAIEERALFAWLPTITPISRQAAFSGKVPRYFANTLHRTDRDEVGWRQFWADHSLSSGEIAFTAVSGSIADLPTIDDIITPQTRAFGITLFKVDKIMHGMELGAVGMAGQVRTWAEEGFFRKLVDSLLSNGFEIFVSSDHGNTEAIGMGVPREGVLSDQPGERCRVYSDTTLQKSCREAFPEAFPFECGGLPESLAVLYAPYGKAFALPGATLVSHGGPSLEEVCVPFIRISAQT